MIFPPHRLTNKATEADQLLNLMTNRAEQELARSRTMFYPAIYGVTFEGDVMAVRLDTDRVGISFDRTVVERNAAALNDAHPLQLGGFIMPIAYNPTSLPQGAPRVGAYAMTHGTHHHAESIYTIGPNNRLEPRSWNHLGLPSPFAFFSARIQA